MKDTIKNTNYFYKLYQERLAIMYNVNLAVVCLFGFHKSEILNRNVKMLMPNLYSIHHDSFIENYVNNKESRLFNKERLVYGKSKSGYALPIYLMIKVSN